MKLWIKILLILAVAGIIAGFLFYHFVINKPQPDFEKIKPDYCLNAASFYNEFKWIVKGKACPGTQMVITIMRPERRLRCDVEISGIRLADYAPKNLR